MRKAVWSLAAVVGLLLAAQPAGAQQIFYEFANSNGVAQSNFSVPVGGTIPIRVYFHETATGAPTLNSNGGLGSGAVRVTFSAPTVAAIQTTADVGTAIPPWNDFGTPSVNANSAVLAELSSFSTGVLPDASGRILLGTFTFHALTQGSVNLTAADPFATGGDTTSFNFPPIDYDPFLQSASATLTVTPVPEPGSLTAIGLAALGLVTAARRRARRGLAARAAAETGR